MLRHVVQRKGAQLLYYILVNNFCVYCKGLIGHYCMRCTDIPPVATPLIISTRRYPSPSSARHSSYTASRRMKTGNCKNFYLPILMTYLT